MKLTKLKTIVPSALIKDFFTEEEKKLILREIEFLVDSKKMFPPELTGTAKSEDGIALKDNNGIFLDNVYRNRNTSDILAITRKYFSPELLDELEEIDTIFKFLRHTNHDTTLMSYYEEGSYYKPHCDQAVYTIIFYYWKTPKQFSGGEFIFSESNTVVDIDPWDVIIFPSFLFHEVCELGFLPGVEKNKLNGRVSISTFVSLNSN